MSRRAASAPLVLLAVCLFGAWAVLDEPTKEERALAERTATALAQASGPLPLHTGPDTAARSRARFFARETVER